jgi:hypothetical protein
MDSLRRDVLDLFLVDNALSSTLTLTAAGRGRQDNMPLLLLSCDYAVSILARLPPRELGMAAGGKDNGGNDDDDARGASVAVRDLGT